MRKILTTALLALTFGANAQTLNPDNYEYPVRNVAGLCSSNFGEMRPDHFHSGVDIKTDGVEGKPVVAVADGYISRIVVQPSGIRAGSLCHPPRRHDIGLRAPVAVPQRHRLARPHRTLPPATQLGRHFLQRGGVSRTARRDHRPVGQYWQLVRSAPALRDTRDRNAAYAQPHSAGRNQGCRHAKAYRQRHILCCCRQRRRHGAAL